MKNLYIQDTSREVPSVSSPLDNGQDQVPVGRGVPQPRRRTKSRHSQNIDTDKISTQTKSRRTKSRRTKSRRTKSRQDKTSKDKISTRTYT